VALVSNGAGTSGFGDLALPGQSTAVTGNVYTAAIGQTPTTALDFGIVRVGDTVTARNIVINNNAALTALNDTLSADLSGVAGPFTGTGNVSGVVAQASANIAVALNTGTAGNFSATGSVAFMSQNADMDDASAGANSQVQLQAQVNNLANGAFNLVSGGGALSLSGTNYLLDLGTVTLGNNLALMLAFLNDVSGPADVLSGNFDLSAADDFALTGWNAVAGFSAGQSRGGFAVNWLASTLGLFTDTIVFNGLGTNASDSTGLAQTRNLAIRANVVGAAPPGTVPEPGTLALLLAAAGAGLLARRRGVARLEAVR